MSLIDLFDFSFLQTGINYSSYTLEDLDHPTLNQIYKIYWDVTLFFTTIFFILMLYTIIKKSSKEMGGYKWYLVHQLGWSYAFDLYMGLWKPIPLWPFYLGYSGGVFNGLSSQFSILSLVGLTFFAVGMGFGIGVALVHRYVQASPLSNYFQDYNRLWLRFLVYVLIFIGIQVALTFPLYYNQIDLKVLQASITSQNPEVGALFIRESSMFGYDPKLNNNKGIIFLGFIILTLFALLIFLFVLYLNYIRILYKNKNQLSATTYKLQKLLFKAIYIQMILTIIFLIFPITICLILAMFGLKWTSIFSLFSFMIISIHTIADFIVMIYFIKPYRIFITGLIKTCLTKIGFKFQGATIIPLPISTTDGTSIATFRHN